MFMIEHVRTTLRQAVLILELAAAAGLLSGCTKDAGAASEQAPTAAGPQVGVATVLTKPVAETQETLALEAQLHHVIERRELELHYQPQQRLSDGVLVGFEALLGWNRPTGTVSSAQFIPLAEESGLRCARGPH
jgi:sensor c-di-GMP phosphodiesterase-like protein